MTDVGKGSGRGKACLKSDLTGAGKNWPLLDHVEIILT